MEQPANTTSSKGFIIPVSQEGRNSAVRNPGRANRLLKNSPHQVDAITKQLISKQHQQYAGKEN